MLGWRVKWKLTRKCVERMLKAVRFQKVDIDKNNKLYFMHCYQFIGGGGGITDSFITINDSIYFKYDK